MLTPKQVKKLLPMSTLHVEGCSTDGERNQIGKAYVRRVVHAGSKLFTIEALSWVGTKKYAFTITQDDAAKWHVPSDCPLVVTTYYREPDNRIFTITHEDVLFGTKIA